MDDFLRARREAQNSAPVTITVMEGDHQIAYWVRIRNDIPHEGMLMVWLPLGTWRHDGLFAETATLPIPLARGFITAWHEDGGGELFHQLIALGYLNGNGKIENVLRLQQIATTAPKKRGR